MHRRAGQIPESVDRAADVTWQKFRDRLSFTRAPERDAALAVRRRPLDNRTPEERMVEKIRVRMTQYPAFYETDPERLAASVARELERIGDLLDRQLKNAKEPVEVWQIPLSVFNWLIDTPHGQSFVRGALRAWSEAAHFNASYAADLGADARARLRAPFLDLAPMLLRVVLQELVETGLVVTFAKQFAGPEFKGLVMRVQSPVGD